MTIKKKLKKQTKKNLFFLIKKQPRDTNVPVIEEKPNYMHHGLHLKSSIRWLDTQSSGPAYI